MRSSHRTELEKVTREKAQLEREKAEMEREKAEMEREKAEMEREKAELENNLIARGMKLKVKEEELDQSKKEAEMYKNSTVKLAKKKFKLEEELIESRKEKSELEAGMGKETDKLKAELKTLGEKNRDLEKKYLLLKVLVCTIQVILCLLMFNIYTLLLFFGISIIYHIL